MSEAIEQARPAPTAKQVGAVLVGNALEFYDFLTYAFFAAQIGRTFFPASTPTGSLLASLATFGAGFLMRPVGAWVIGRMGDRMGRRPAMLLSFSLMGVAVAGLALTPSYASIGVAAPLLVIAFRLLQGFALGGEVGPSTAFLVEISPPHRRGFFASLQYMTQDLSVLASGLVGFALASTLSDAQLDAWGWRVAVGLGAVIVPFGIMMRRSLVETLHDEDPHDAPVATGIRPYIKVSLLALMMLASGTIVTYCMNYLNTYASNTLGMDVAAGFGSTVVLGLVGMTLGPLAGILSDRFGRKPVMMINWALLLAATIPSFLMLSHLRTPGALYGATAALTVFNTLGSAAILVTVTESLPRRIRSGALGLIYALAISTFGGSTQFVVTWLIDISGNPLVPAWYMMGAITVGLTAMSLLDETAPLALARRAAKGR